MARLAGSGNLGRTPKVPPQKVTVLGPDPERDAVGSAGNEVSEVVRWSSWPTDPLERADRVSRSFEF